MPVPIDPSTEVTCAGSVAGAATHETYTDVVSVDSGWTNVECCGVMNGLSYVDGHSKIRTAIYYGEDVRAKLFTMLISMKKAKLLVMPHILVCIGVCGVYESTLQKPAGLLINIGYPKPTS
jgi:hypothetical protein